jgi:DNA-directed RNA polymerase I, II, and III subunit RPABC2
MSYYDDDSDNGSIKSSESDNESDIEVETKKISKPKKLIEDDEVETDDENESIVDVDEEDDEELDEEEDEDEDDEDDGKGDEGGSKKGGAFDELDSDDEDDEIKPVERKKKITIASNVGKKGPIPSINDISLSDDDDDEADEDGELYLKKFDKDINDNYLLNFHPECALHNYDEVLAMSKVIRDKNGIIIDDLHRTIPYLTKYERARILGQRAKQINSGATAFVKVPENVIDGYLIAELELKEKRIPFIIRRPLPNGGSEYWSVKDLENIIF